MKVTQNLGNTSKVLISQNEDFHRFLHGDLRKGNIHWNCILLVLLHVNILFPNATVALKQKTLTGNGLSHIGTVLVDWHGAFIKGDSQLHALVSFWYMFQACLLRYRLIMQHRFGDNGDTFRERCVLVFCNILSSTKCCFSQPYLLSPSIFLLFLLSWLL